MSDPIKNRYDIIYYFEVTDGNPNGDPDAANLPRIDPETGQGLVTDVCLKRKVRNFVDLTMNGQQGFRIFVKEGAILNRQIEEAYENSEAVKECLAKWAEFEKKRKARKNKGKNTEEQSLVAPQTSYEDLARQWLCEQFFDIRTFGAVLNTGKEQEDEETESKIRKTAGQVRGPVQFGIARSVDRILQQEHTLTVCAARTEDKPVKQQIGIQGRKPSVPYALYRVHIYVSAPLADVARKGTGFSESDLNLLKRALNEMFEHDHAAARANMAPVRCVAFKHDSALGNARSDLLFKMVTAKVKPECLAAKRPPRSGEDYAFSLPSEQELPKGVTMEKDWVEIPKERPPVQEKVVGTRSATLV